MSAEPKAVVLLSGGMDSATALAIARAEKFDLYALTLRYGQRHELEVEAARQVARQAGVADHVVMDIDMRTFGGSALTDDVAVPKGRSAEAMGQGIPVTYVPARNTIFLSLALAWAEVLGAWDIYIGVNAIDYSGYPDCRLEFIDAFERMANLATKAAVESERSISIHTPLIELTKGQIIGRGLQLGVDYALTRTCYDPTAEGLACGRCDACQLRLKGFAQAGTTDPIRYADKV